MNPSTQPPASVDDLVAYLDGELDHESSQRIEQHLARDSKYRQRLQQLQHAWDLLDSLPRVEANNSFARTTVELVAQNVAEDLDKKSSQHKQRKSLEGIVGVAAVLVTSVAGYLAAHYLLAAPERQLLEDLPMIERLDQYRILDNVESDQGDVVEFLRLLEKEQLFTPEEFDAI